MPSAAVVGLGLMGGSLGLALREAGWSVTGLDRDPAAAAEAARRGAIGQALPSLEEAAGSDLVVLAVPVLAVRRLLAEIPAGTLVTDVASTKAEVLAWAAEAGVDFVGGHPLCGSERSGVEAARADLFQGAVWALTRRHPLIESMVVATGARPFVVDAEEHDRLVAGTSHAAFAISAAYMLAAADSADWPAMAPLSAGGFRDMTRLAGGDAEMYAGVLATNAANVEQRLREFQTKLAELVAQLEGDPEAVRGWFERARQARLDWDASRER